MTLWQEFRKPTSISEAIEDLNNAPQPAIPIAGGTDILLDIKQGRHKPAHTLIDLTGIPELNVIDMRNHNLYIGAAVPVNRITIDPLVIEHALALVEACNLIAGPQVRNIASLGGNVAHALPAADGTIALTALAAKAEIADPTGLKILDFTELFLGPGKSAIDKSSEIITGFYIPAVTRHQASSFKRIMRPQGVALPILNCAVWVDRDSDLVKDIRISIGPGGPKPFRATDAEAAFRDKPVTTETIAFVIDHILGQAKFRTSPMRASANYRKYIVAGLFKDTFLAAWKRAE